MPQLNNPRRNELRRRWLANENAIDLAVEFGIATHTVYNNCRDLPRPRQKSGTRPRVDRQKVVELSKILKPKEIAERFSVSVPYIYRILRPATVRKNKIPPETIQRIRHLRAVEKLTLMEIHRVTGISRSWVYELTRDIPAPRMPGAQRRAA